MGVLDGKVAVITGATSGIGERIAEVFLEEGAQVVAAGRRASEGAALEKRLGTNASFIRTDVSQEADVQAMIDHAVQRFGPIDILINNAGSTAQVVGIAELDMSHFDQVMGVNIRGVVLCMKYAARAMLPRGKGSIVNISSVAGISRRLYRSSLWRVERCRVGGDAFGGNGTWREGHSRQCHLSWRNRDRDICQERGSRGFKSRSRSGCGARSVRHAATNSPRGRDRGYRSCSGLPCQ